MNIKATALTAFFVLQTVSGFTSKETKFLLGVSGVVAAAIVYQPAKQLVSKLFLPYALLSNVQVRDLFEEEIKKLERSYKYLSGELVMGDLTRLALTHHPSSFFMSETDRRIFVYNMAPMHRVVSMLEAHCARIEYLLELIEYRAVYTPTNALAHDLARFLTLLRKEIILFEAYQNEARMLELMRLQDDACFAQNNAEAEREYREKEAERDREERYARYRGEEIPERIS